MLNSGAFSEADLLFKQSLSTDKQDALLPSLALSDCVTTVFALKVNRIKDLYKVSVRIPPDNEKSNLIRIEGDPQGVQQAKKELLELASRMVSRMCDAWEATGFRLLCSLGTFRAFCVPLAHRVLGCHDKCEFVFMDMSLYSLAYHFSVNLE